MSPELKEAVDEIVKALDARLAEQTKDIEKRLEQFATSGESRMTVHFERMEGLVMRAAEGFDATLGSIDRRLKRLERKWDTRILDHEKILATHNERLKTVERQTR